MLSLCSLLFPRPACMKKAATPGMDAAASPNFYRRVLNSRVAGLSGADPHYFIYR